MFEEIAKTWAHPTNDEVRKWHSKPTEIVEGLPPAPPFDSDHTETAEPDVRLTEPTAIQVFIAWERLRIVFNVGALIALFVAPAFLFFRGDHLRGNMAAFLITANLLVCIGPVGENHLCWFGVRRGLARVISVSFLTTLFVIWIKIMSVAQSV